jgi:hypothetical protein
MRRNDWLAAAAGHQREKCRDNENAPLAASPDKRRKLVRQHGDGVASLARSTIRSIAM